MEAHIMNNKKVDDDLLSQLEFLLVCKVKDFHTAGYEEVNTEIIKSYLTERKWRETPSHIHQMTKDVLAITYSDILDYLKLRDVYYAEEESIHKIFSNLI